MHHDTRTCILMLAAVTMIAALAPPAAQAGDVCYPDESDCDSLLFAAKPDPWPDGIVPVAFAPGLSSAKIAKALEAMEKWVNTNANLAFVPRTTQSAFIQIGDGGNTASNVGYQPGVQLDVGISEFFWGDWTMTAHELGHALGFFHEHQRWDRDNFIDVMCTNMAEGYAEQYRPVPQANWITTATPYDFRSIMHYRPCWKGCHESDCDEDDFNDSNATMHLQPGVDPANWDVMGRWGENGITSIDATDMRNVYGSRRNIYVDWTAGSPGNGYLRTPYQTVFSAWSEAANNDPLPYRLIITGGDYNEPDNVTIDFPVIMRAVPGGPNVVIR